MENRIAKLFEDDYDKSEGKVEEVIRVWIAVPGQEPTVTMISSDLESLKSVVGGYLEAVYLENDLVLFVNESGLLFDLPLNFVFQTHRIHGTVFVAKREDPELVSLTDSDIDFIQNDFWPLCKRYFG